jgi:hypothetical protein
VNAVASTFGTLAVAPVVPVAAAAVVEVVALVEAEELDELDDPPQAATVTAISAVAPTTTVDLSGARMALLLRVGQEIGDPSYRHARAIRPEISLQSVSKC